MNSRSSALVLVMERFPEHGETLARLYRKSESFLSLCDDYEECRAALDSCSRSIREAAAGYQKEWAMLLHDLEEEILEYLEREGGPIDYRTQETEF